MKPVERLPFAQWADIRRTEKFITVEALSGYRRTLRESDGYVIHLAPDAAEDLLGASVLRTFDKSRFIWPPDEREFFEADRIVQCQRNWHKEIMGRYAYKTKTGLYKNMNWVVAERSEGKISIKPHQRDKPEYWRSLPPEQTVIIPETRDALVVGAAVRLALDRCE